MHSCTNELVVQITLCDVRGFYSTLQYRRPTQTQKMMPSPTLVKLEMRYVYLGPCMKATNAFAMNGHVMAAF